MRKFLSGLGLFLFLFIRGFALWVLIPFALLAWLLVHSWAQRASPGQAVSWYDQAFSMIVLLGPLRPMVRPTVTGKFVGISQMRTLPKYRLRWLSDLV